MAATQEHDPAYYQESHGQKLIVAGAVLTTICTLGLIARAVSSRMKNRAVDASDLTLLWAYVINVAQYGMYVWTVQNAGWGRHVETLSKNEMVSFRKVYLSTGLLQPSLLAAAKMSVLLLLYKIFAARKFRAAAVTLMAVVMIWWVGTTLTAFLICHPFNSFWGASEGQCGKQHLFNILDPIPWIVTDFAILVLPLPMVRKLQMATRQKVALTALFLFGGLTCIVSCVRYKYVFFEPADITYDTVNLGIWQLAEANVSVLCACLLASKPCVMLLVPDAFIIRMNSYFSSLRSSRQSSSKGHGTRVTVQPIKSGSWTEVGAYPSSLHEYEVSKLPAGAIGVSMDVSVEKQSRESSQQREISNIL